ncbi:157R [Bovine adenovirus 3]|uniref:E1B protein, small T-antigen n=1 Tax=Bovine adenovirus B serotype 3 TaxID=10510 RepID=Q64843_ADEB3|nr:157R [Bovine adenovirus 3]AP_000022.1 E1B 19K [Bovine mastadenovirus B]AAD09715.1 157R [Bovine adenovirus 3]BAA04817.1 17K protein [Bovine adenovirus 3]
MDHLSVLLDLKLLRSIVAGASNRTGVWKRRLWLGRLTQLVHDTCVENESIFLNSLPGNEAFLRLLRSGYFEVFDVFVVPELHLDTPGRVVAALALLVFILNDLDANSASSGFDSGFLVDRLCVPLWLKARAFKITQSSRSTSQPSSSPDKTTQTTSQ